MSRLYSGNLNAFMDAVHRLEKLGCLVNMAEGYEPMRMLHIVNLRVTLGSDLIGEESFGRWDIDVTYNSATEWLHELAEQLEYWK